MGKQTTADEARAYIVAKDLQGLSERLMRALLLARPDDHKAFIVSFLQTGNCESAGINRQLSDAYSEEKGLKSFFKDLISGLVKERPEDPSSYIVTKLQEA